MLLAVTGIYTEPGTNRKTLFAYISSITFPFCRFKLLFFSPPASLLRFLLYVFIYHSAFYPPVLCLYPSRSFFSVCLSRDVQCCSAMCSACSPTVTHLSLLSPCTYSHTMVSFFTRCMHCKQYAKVHKQTFHSRSGEYIRPSRCSLVNLL